MDIHLFHHFLAIPALLNAPMWVLEEGLKRELLSAGEVEAPFLFPGFSALFSPPQKKTAHYKRREGCF